MATAPIQEFLKKALEANAEPASLTWLAEQAEKIKSSSSPNPFFLAFSRASRYFKKEAVSWTEGATISLPEGVDPSAWDSLQVARIYLVLQLPFQNEAWQAILQQLFETGDMYEQQALYAALPLFPNAERLLPRAGRAVMPEVWRLLVPFMGPQYLDDLKKVLAATDALEQKAGALAAFQSSYAPAKELLATYPLLQEACANGAYRWEDLGIEFQKNRV